MLTPLLVPIPQVAKALGVGRSTAYELVQRGELRTVAIGARRLVPIEELEAYVDRLLDAAGITPERDESPASTPGARPTLTSRQDHGGRRDDIVA